MVYRLLLTAVILTAPAASAFAQNASDVQKQPLAPPRVPNAAGTPPRFVTLVKVDKGKGEITLAEVREQMVTQAYTEKIKQGNQEVLVTKTAMRSVPVHEVRVFQLKEVRFSSPQGEQISQAKALERLKPGAIVLATPGQQKLSAEYAKLVRENVVIVDLPQPGFAGGGVMGLGIAPRPVVLPPAIPSPKVEDR